MKRRDTERDHAYAHEDFKDMKIYDIQGILKEGDINKCGIEAYQVSSFNSIRFDLLNQEEEKARFFFCQQLNIPYLIIVVSEDTSRYRIYNSDLSGNLISFLLLTEYNEQQFVVWWRKQQSFTQKKGMYNAGARISESKLDTLLFANSLAWGVNVDGFSYDINTGKIKAIYEKRICTCKPPYSISSYDPDKFFHGTQSRSGDFPSWVILGDLFKKFNFSFLSPKLSLLILYLS